MERLQAALADRYTIERELGQGGMATVYLAEDVKHHRQVAIKVLREDLAASMGSGRFLREIEIAARLQHPHILPMHDSGEAEGFLYYVMPFVKGESLRQRLAREGELPVHDAVRLTIEVVDALTLAHEHGVVHRDIKPDNIMLSGRHALVMDFGVAKAISEATGRNTVTTLGVAVGTPAYMSPEQAAADPHIDHRSDIYAVGAMLYEMLAGRPPFIGTTPQQVLAAQVTEAPDPVSKRRPAIPPPLEAVVMRCLAKRPADRFQTASELHAALEPLATPSLGITPTATRPSTAIPAPSVARRWAPWILGIGLIGAAAFAFLRRPAGTRTALVSPVTLQVTTSGTAATPSISPDGKSVAYSTRSCDSAGRCLFNLVVEDVGGAGTLTVLAGATGIYSTVWSPDGRHLLMRGSFAPEIGLYLVPATVQAPRQYLGCCYATFLATSDTLLLTPPRVSGSSATQLRVLTVSDRRVQDSVQLRHNADTQHLVVSPDGRFMATRCWRDDGAVMACVWARDGRLTDSVVVDRIRGAPIQWAPDGSGLLITWPVPDIADVYDLLFQPLTNAGHINGPRVRLATRLPAEQGQFQVTADGKSLAFGETSYQNSVVALEHGSRSELKFSIHRVATSSTGFDGLISDDGRYVMLYRLRPIGSDRTGYQLSYMPFSGGTEIPASGVLDALTQYRWAWPDNGQPTIEYSFPAGKGADQVDAFDVMNGQRRTVLTLSDSTSGRPLIPLPGGRYLTGYSSPNHIGVIGPSGVLDRQLKLPDGFSQLVDVTTSPDGNDVVLEAGEPGGAGGIVLTRLHLADGAATKPVHIPGNGAPGLQWLNNGDVLVVVNETEATHALYCIAPDGSVTRFGVLPFPDAVRYSISGDGLRMLALVGEYRRDIWLIKNFHELLHQK